MTTPTTTSVTRQAARRSVVLTPLAVASALVCAASLASWTPPAQAQTGLSAADAVQQVYVGFYGRPGDPDGLAYWAGRVGASGVSSILNQFSGSLEANQLFAGMSNEGKITFIYRILFNRDPDGPGLAFWGGELSNGNRTLPEISYEILKGAINEDLGKIRNKLAAANYFTEQVTARNLKNDYSVQADIFLARNWLGTIDETSASLDAAKNAIDALLNRVGLAGKPQSVTGVLATPAGSAQTAFKAIRFMPEDTRPELQSQADAVLAALPPSTVCFGVPDGYTALANASVVQKGGFDEPLAAAVQADNCGMFVLASAPTAVALDISAPGYRSISTPISVFQDPDRNGLPDPVTLIPTTSSYQLTSVRVSDTGGGVKVFFNVIDSATKKAVLGISGAQVSVLNNGSLTPVSAVGYGSSISSSAASVALVLDASGSMSGTPLQIAAAAARLFVSRKGSADELSLTLFDDDVIFLNQANTNKMVADNRLSFTDGVGNPIAFDAPVNGYTNAPLFAEQALKLYDRRSDAWPGSSTPDPFFRIKGSYPFGGSTALYTASVTATQSLAQSPNRRYALVMTDGADNASRPNTLQTAIDTAKNNNVATYTVAAGRGANAAELTRLAQETGGTFTSVPDLTQLTKLSAAFDAIRTSIAFDYAAVLGVSPLPGSLTLRVDVGGSVLESTVAVP